MKIFFFYFFHDFFFTELEVAVRSSSYESYEVRCQFFVRSSETPEKNLCSRHKDLYGYHVFVIKPYGETLTHDYQGHDHYYGGTSEVTFCFII